MADPSRGRGRGLALLQALKKSQMMDSPPTSEEPSPEPTPLPSAAPSVASTDVNPPTTTSIGGRGRIAAMLLSKMHQRPGEPTFTPAGDISPSAPPPIRGAGRGLKLLQNLKAVTSAEVGASGDMKQLTQKMAESSVSSTVPSTVQTSAKNKYFREVKDTPPVVMKGQTGTPVHCTANFIYLNFEENNVFEYEAKFEPEQDYKHLRFKLLNEHSQYFKEKTFDGTTLYVPHMLPEEATNLVSVNPFDNSKVHISIIFRRTRRLSEMIHIYNVLFKHIMKDLQLVRFGRQHFNEHAAIQIPQYKLEVWPGYVTAVDEYEGGLMLTLDSTSRVLRTQSVLSFIKETVQTDGANWKKAMAEKLIGCSVMTTYNKKLFRVDSIDDTMTPRSTFEKIENGETVKISYIDYYKNNYGIEIKDWDQPMLISRQTKRMPGSEAPTDFMICLVPELCQLTGLTDEQRNNFRLMKDVATYTRITPNQRHRAFKQYIQNVLNNETAKKRLAGWGLSIAKETIDITARTLPPEDLYFGRNSKVPGKPDANWNAEVTRNAVMQAVDVLRWALLYTDRDRQITMDFVDILKRSGGPMGINVSAPEMVRLPNDRTDSYVTALKKCFNPSLQLIVCICPTSRDDRYSAIKKICCADNPVPSQVINARTLMNQKKVRGITQKILLQINCKLGGTLWNISIPMKTAMIVGIDSYHDASRKKRSVCAFVASYNQSMTHWYSRAVFQERGQEIVDSLKSCLVDALKHFLNTNGHFPERIIIYRDGVGDGQLKLLQQYEIPQMKIGFSVVHERYSPMLTYVVVQKRINTRIFMKTGHGYENPPPGTVVDHAITRRDWYDFLIASQKVEQGTVTPTHYIVVHDSSGMSPDQCQRLTYKLCHLYYNWPGAVRVPAPCQYAHRLAQLVGQSIHHQPSEALADKLFFL
ncbi:piwi-like protein Ago3 [Plodia interpunctella]|uniref:piwi-like protein Ago3 n=1 Tax=Plodia interpunctella TaxID=58824 RepID=UPI0023686823|nr:piwi-like protein Ago3 [Plodia interpunctella]XP_053610722.1 piwi-like protein Ago3 [Plodia interpunctella]